MKDLIMIKKQIIASVTSIGVILLTPSLVKAGGFDYLDQDVSLLFKEGNIAEVGLKFVKPSRRYSNVRRVGITRTPTQSEDFAQNLYIPHFQLKRDVSENVGCLLAYRFPFGTDQSHDKGWEGRYYATDTDLDVQSLGVDCAYTNQLSDEARLVYIGGLRIEKSEATINSQASSAAITRGANLRGPDSSVSNNLDSTEVGYTLGIAYQIPKKGVNASLVYNSEVDHNYKGTQRVDIPVGVLGAASAAIESPISLNVINPQSLQLNVSSGIKPGWLAFGFARWVDWSTFENLAIRNDRTGAVSIGDVSWSDTWTTGLGIAHRLNKKNSVYTLLFADEDAASDQVRGARTSVADSVGIKVGLTSNLSEKSYIKASFTYRRLTDTKTLGYAPTNTNGATDPLAGGAFTAKTAASNVYVLKLVYGWKF